MLHSTDRRSRRQRARSFPAAGHIAWATISALRTDEGTVVDETPTGLGQPAAYVFDAVKVSLQEMDGELSSHEGGAPLRAEAANGE